MNNIQYIGSRNQVERVFEALKKQAYILADNGKKLTLELAIFKNKRTNAQNAYYWLFNNEVATFLNNAGLTYGKFKIPYTKDIIHEINKKFGGLESTKELTVCEFCNYMDKLIVEWQERTHGEFYMSELPQQYMENRGYNG